MKAAEREGFLFYNKNSKKGYRMWGKMMQVCNTWKESPGEGEKKGSIKRIEGRGREEKLLRFQRKCHEKELQFE